MVCVYVMKTRLMMDTIPARSNRSPSSGIGVAHIALSEQLAIIAVRGSIVCVGNDDDDDCDDYVDDVVVGY